MHWQNMQHTPILDAEDGSFIALGVEIQRVAIIGLPGQMFYAQHPCQDSILSDVRFKIRMLYHKNIPSGNLT